MTILNFNIGVLGHVDSGKTSLAKALSTIASTACFDKNPQSKQRGITLDLGFSSFTIESNEVLKQNGFDHVQYTLVDCPGHAGLIKTIIGGAQIIDMMLLVIDITKGIQTQTAECLIIGEICCNKMLIVLNKIDLVEEKNRAKVIENMNKRLMKTLENTKFANSPIVAVAANQSKEGNKENLEEQISNISLENKAQTMLNIDVLIETLKAYTFLPNRNEQEGPFLFAVDHCFTIKGQGTVMTGTVLNGNIKINDTVEIPILKLQKKVKSIQVFRKPVEKAIQGDRCGVCLVNFDSKQFERGIVSSPNFVKNSYAVIICINKIKHFKHKIDSGSKFHISIGHETVLAKIELFGENITETESYNNNNNKEFNFEKEYFYVNQINLEQNEINKEDVQKKKIRYYALIDFCNDLSEHLSAGVLCVPNNLVIGSKLDTDIHLNQCRIAFYGNVLHSFTNKDFKEIIQNSTLNINSHLSSLKIFKEKVKEGIVERKHDEFTVIGKSLFKKETNMDIFVNLKVILSTGDEGYIEGSFGQSGKFKVRIPKGLSQKAKDELDSKSKKKPNISDTDNQVSNTEAQNGPIKIFLNYKRFIYDEKKKITQ